MRCVGGAKWGGVRRKGIWGRVGTMDSCGLDQWGTAEWVGRVVRLWGWCGDFWTAWGLGWGRDTKNSRTRGLGTSFEHKCSQYFFLQLHLGPRVHPGLLLCRALLFLCWFIRGLLQWVLGLWCRLSGRSDIFSYCRSPAKWFWHHCRACIDTTFSITL